jgi:hypothetical protein
MREDSLLERVTAGAKRPSIHGSTTPFPDYDTEPVMAFSAT